MIRWLFGHANLATMEGMMTQIEFYVGATATKHIAAIKASTVPRPGEYISIRKTTYLVERVTWAIDGNLDIYGDATLRANVDLTQP